MRVGLTKIVVGSALVGGVGGFMAGFTVASHVYTDDYHRDQINSKLKIGLGVTVISTIALVVLVRRAI